ncbi:MAG: class I SAM-dependent methyltransferase [Flavobacteriales bacterium]
MKSNINHEEEAERVKGVYAARVIDATAHTSLFTGYMVSEREAVMATLLHKYNINASAGCMLEIGAGAGANINFFIRQGFKVENIYANELLESRLEGLKKNYPGVHLLPGNALLIDTHKKFDLVFQSTVFTSILSDTIKKEMASKMLELLKPGGIVLWYDFTYNNPANKNVKGIPVSEIQALFGKNRIIETRKVTLAPPIGRRVGRLYKLFNILPFLRTHVIAVIR